MASFGEDPAGDASALPARKDEDAAGSCPAAMEPAFQAVGHAFADPALLVRALTHASRCDDRLQSYERLEFLGDAVLGLAVSRRLYDAHPGLPEGRLTEIKSAAVSRTELARTAERLGLGPCIACGRGVADQAGPTGGMLADVYEAVVAALYLDAGLEAAERFIERTLGEALDALAAAGETGNPKSLLQEHRQQAGLGLPDYEVAEEEGPDHAKVFHVRVILDGVVRGWGEGPSKKDAEQAAAAEALRRLDADTPADAPGAPPGAASGG